MSEELREWEVSEDCAPDEPFDEPLFGEPQPVMNVNGLFPCPFCGGKAEVRYSEPTERFAVVCSKCHAQTKAWFAGKHGDEYAIEDWNSRYDEVKPTKIDPSRCKFGYDECIEVSYRGHTLCHLCGKERTGAMEEPKTCHNVSQYGFFECSECGASIVAESCGEFSPDIWVENGQLNFCPNCGTKVVEDGK